MSHHQYYRGKNIILYTNRQFLKLTYFRAIRNSNNYNKIKHVHEIIIFIIYSIYIYSIILPIIRKGKSFKSCIETIIRISAIGIPTHEPWVYTLASPHQNTIYYRINIGVVKNKNMRSVSIFIRIFFFKLFWNLS